MMKDHFLPVSPIPFNPREVIARQRRKLTFWRVYGAGMTLAVLILIYLQK
jgi:hypothetical protein